MCVGSTRWSPDVRQYQLSTIFLSETGAYTFLRHKRRPNVNGSKAPTGCDTSFLFLILDLAVDEAEAEADGPEVSFTAFICMRFCLTFSFAPA